ncbi:hypothetical protein, partial [Methanospirillum purgamenti]|uniref:hypothetical protein n=1 Tax=Methanospirillum purgamenti TaxID=2834276 RepID=UPI002A23F720
PILHFNAFVGSPLKRPLTLLPEGYILLYCPSRTDIPRPPAPDDSGSVWDNKVVLIQIYSHRFDILNPQAIPFIRHSGLQV